MLIKEAKRKCSRERCENDYKSNPVFQKYKRAYIVTKYVTNTKYQKQQRDTSKITCKQSIFSNKSTGVFLNQIQHKQEFPECCA